VNAAVEVQKLASTGGGDILSTRAREHAMRIVAGTFAMLLILSAFSETANADCRIVFVNGKKTTICDKPQGPTLLPNPPVKPKPKCNGCKT
jgi:hypothetical protein